MSLINNINLNYLPKHIAIIMDGNGRWAKKQNKERTFGHQQGVSAVKKSIEAASDLGIEFVTLYTFSTENWSRPKEEVDMLMELLVNTIHSELHYFIKNNVKLRTIGNIEKLNDRCRETLNDAILQTKHCSGTTLVLALNYSSRLEITSAIKNIALQIKNKELLLEDITEELISKNLDTHFMPDPDLLIRTSGELRISNYLLWQIAYSELYFTDTLWPDFDKETFFEAIINYQNRERRFGKTSEQINNI